MSQSPQLPNEFFSTKTLYSLSGAAAAVWLMCLVLSLVLPPHTLNVYHWRIIALLASEILAIFIILQNKVNKLDGWVLGIINGLLIFINASGINAVTSGLAFVDKESISTEKQVSIQKPAYLQAGFTLLTKQENWWPDPVLKKKNTQLLYSNNKLKEQNVRLIASYNTLTAKCNGAKILKDSTEAVKKESSEKPIITDQSNLLKLERRLQILAAENLALKKQAITSSPVIKQEPDDKLNQLSQQLLASQKENEDLKSKLRKIKNLQQLLREADKYGL